MVIQKCMFKQTNDPPKNPSSKKLSVTRRVISEQWRIENIWRFATRESIFLKIWRKMHRETRKKYRIGEKKISRESGTQISYLLEDFKWFYWEDWTGYWSNHAKFYMWLQNWCCQYKTMTLVAFNLSKQIIVCQNYHLKQNPWRIFCSIILSSRNLLLNTRHLPNAVIAEQIFIFKISNSVTDNRLVS